MAMRVESTQEESTWHWASAIRLLQGRLRRSARRTKELQHNNGMHPTANSAALIENLNGFGVECAAGDAGRWAARIEF